MSQTYRLYRMSPASGDILSFAEFEASTDEVAIALAGEQEGDQPLELWCQHRKVNRFVAILAGAHRRA